MAKSRRRRSKSRAEIEVPPLQDWRTTDAEEIERRRERAREERMQVSNRTPEQGVFSNFEVRSASGRTYGVEIRDVRGSEFSCQCVDFTASGLGTCKHVEAVLLWLKRRHRPELKAAQQGGSTRCDIVPDRTGEGLRLVLPPGRSVPRSLMEWFDATGGCLTRDWDAVLTHGRKVEARNPAVRISQDVEPWRLVLERRRESVALRHEYEEKVQSGAWPVQETLMPLLPYQREGMLHLAFRERALLADEMGLGKTIQAIAACALLHRLGKVRRVLAVSPASLKGEWEEQIRRFTPLPSQLVFGHHIKRRQTYTQLAARTDGPVFILTNYEQVVADIGEINGVLRPDVVILDEAQRIKNWDTQTARQIKQLASRYAFVLTGTPIENRIDELRSLVDFLDPSLLGSLFRFNREFYQFDDRGRPVGCRNLDVLHQRVKPVLLRRRKSDVESELPDRTDHLRFVKLTERQRRAYTEFEHEVSMLAAKAERRPLTKAEMERLQIFLGMMRMTCDTNYILDDQDLTNRECPKLPEVMSILFEAMAENAKVIVFSEWERMLELVRHACADAGIEVAWHTGSVTQQKRREDIRRFKEDPACRVFLSTDAGATGLNLQVASVVVNCDLPWNPARLEQRIARAWRKFQSKPVTVFNLVSEETIEQRMLDTLATKRIMASSVLDRDADSPSDIQLRAGRKDMLERIRQLTGTDPATTGTDENSGSKPVPVSVDAPTDFARRMRERLGGQLVGCELRIPTDGSAPSLVVVVEHGAQARAPWVEDLRQESFAKLEDPKSTPRIEVLDRATFEAIERMMVAGLIVAVPQERRDLLADPVVTPPSPPPLSEEELKRLGEAKARANHLLRRARVLGEAEFVEESWASLGEVLLPLGIALSIANRHPAPTKVDDLRSAPCNGLWKEAAADAAALGAGAGDWKALTQRFAGLLEGVKG